VPELPFLNHSMHIINYMQRIGFPSSSETYVKHTEIKCWSDSQGIELYPFEHQIIFDSFKSFSGKKSHFEANPMEPSPFTNATPEDSQNEKNNAVDSMVARMLKNV